AGEDRQSDLAFLNAGLQITHNERRLFHIFYVKLRLRTCDLEAQVKPDVSRNVDGAGETGSVVDLPVETSVENRSVLKGIRKTTLVLTQINPFGVGAVARNPELDAEETAACWGCYVYINNRVAHFSIFHGCCSAIDKEALSALVFGWLRLSFEKPA